MADVFISYKREDRERIAPLARALEARGYTVWWDLELVPSQKFERQIKRELDAAKCVIVVWTDRSIADDGMYVSDWVQIEADSGGAWNDKPNWLRSAYRSKGISTTRDYDWGFRIARTL